MYANHPAFKRARNSNNKLWRYMDFPGFLSLLIGKSLCFRRADKFADRYEGVLTKLDVEDQRERARQMVERWSDEMRELNKDWRFEPSYHWFPPKYCAINCWHENEFESAAMWDLYAKKNEGIAVVSTWKRLRGSIIDPRTIYIGKIKYINRETDRTDHKNGFNPFLQKGKSYEHEKEVRALVYVPSTERDPVMPTRIRQDVETIKDGLSISVNLDRLVEKVFIAPLVPAWQAEVVRDVIKQYGHNFDVIQSDLYGDPIY